MGRDWWRAEVQKPPAERHQVIQWNVHLCEYQKLQKRGPDGLYAVQPDGVTAAYMLLAYDLYVLRHHQALQEMVVRRLKMPEQFQGARFELFVAATLIRAGCDLRFSDESDSTTKHPELAAIHRATGEAFDVEAKSRHRPGVLGYPGSREDPDSLKIGIRRLVNRASAKCGERPLAVFIDLNLPAELVSPWNQDWLDEVRSEITRIALDADGVWPFALAVVTNNPYHYGQFAEPEPIPMGYIMEPGGTIRNPLSHVEIANDIERSLRQSRTIPIWFPDESDPRHVRSGCETRGVPAGASAPVPADSEPL